MSDTITITGTIGTQPEFKRTPDGLAITSFRLASSHRYRNPETNTWVEGETSWYSVSIFRVLAENAFASFQKGERVIVAGKLRIREWETSVKKGVTAQIDADSIGHDLQFGTTRFAKSRSDSTVSSSPTAQSQPTSANEWAAPQSESEAVWGGPGLGVPDPDGHHDAAHAHVSSAADDSRAEETEDERELALLSGEPPF